MFCSRYAKTSYSERQRRLLCLSRSCDLGDDEYSWNAFIGVGKKKEVRSEMENRNIEYDLVSE